MTQPTAEQPAELREHILTVLRRQLPDSLTTDGIVTLIHTREREARRLALEEAAGIADEWADLAKSESQTDDADFLYRLADAIRAQAPTPREGEGKG